MLCSKCGTNNPSTNNFCAKCGTALTKHCAKCQVENPPASDFCGKCGASLSEPAEPLPAAPPELTREAPGPAPTGERRHLTVLFCDLVGSTPLSQQLDAEEWRDIIAQYQQAAAGAVARFGGHVAKNLGDGLLIYFGWPTAREDDPERAVRAGLAILDAMVPLNSALAAGDGMRLAVRVGIHTGPVVIADGGEVFGETPNVAARVQTAAEPDTVVIAAATQRLVAGMFVVEDRGPQALKGVHEPVTLYRVVQPSGVRGRLDVTAGRLTPFVGREPELATVIDHWERVQDGEGQNVLIVGEAGVGKSRLVGQLREHLAAVPHTWLECSATPYTETTPFHPVIELARQGLAFAPEDTPRDKLGKIEAALTLAKIVSPEATALMADFLNLERGEDAARLAMSPEMQRRKTMELLAAWELALAQAQPLVLVVEDLHWSDPSSLELLGRLIAQSPTARVMLVGTARPEFVAPWPERSNLTAIKLARLTKRQARLVIERVATAMEGAAPPDDSDGARPTALSDAMIDAIVARADGIPLYLEELARNALEPGVAQRVEEIPATLADSLMARLDRLSAAKEVAQRASVLGREFSYPLLAAVVGLEEAVLRHGLARLDEAEILFVRGEPPQSSYTFKHALLQEAAYESLLKRTRRQLHGRVVDVLLAQFPERAAAEPELIARHAELAGRIDEAITYYQRAGEQAQARSAHGEAIRHLRQAIALLATHPEGGARGAHEIPLQLALGESLGAARGLAHVEVEAAFERARVLCEASGDACRLGLALGGLAVFSFNSGQVERASVLGARVLAIAGQSGDTELAIEGHFQVGAAELYQGKFTSSLAHFEAARTLYQPGRHHGALREDTGPAVLGWIVIDQPVGTILGSPVPPAADTCEKNWNFTRKGAFEPAKQGAKGQVIVQQNIKPGDALIGIMQVLYDKDALQTYDLKEFVERYGQANIDLTYGNPEAGITFKDYLLFQLTEILIDGQQSLLGDVRCVFARSPSDSTCAAARMPLEYVPAFSQTTPSLKNPSGQQGQSGRTETQKRQDGVFDHLNEVLEQAKRYNVSGTSPEGRVQKYFSQSYGLLHNPTNSVDRQEETIANLNYSQLKVSSAILAELAETHYELADFAGWTKQEALQQQVAALEKQLSDASSANSGIEKVK